MPCNPSIGGPGKSQLVREIDALGGAMALAADASAVHVRILNESRGPAVQALRAQTDREEYSRQIRLHLDKCENLFLLQDTVVSMDTRHGRIDSVSTRMGDTYHCRACVIAAGTFFRGRIFIGSSTFSGGRATEPASTLFPECLEKHGVSFKRFKTGTPPRVNMNSLDLSVLEVQPGLCTPHYFSHVPGTRMFDPSLLCYRLKSNSQTSKVIMDNLDNSPLYSREPAISGPGPRYCPSIETKVKRFPDKQSHVLFLEPEGVNTSEGYVSGFSTSMPYHVQVKMVQTLPGFANARITRPGYAVEYDVISPGQLGSNLEFKNLPGLFSAGQINGTSGYEEAACQGQAAGINAGLSIMNEPPFIPDPLNSYTGALIELVTSMDLSEPLRMFTSLVSRRLAVRSDNADLRMCAMVDPELEKKLLYPGLAQNFKKRKKYYKICCRELKSTSTNIKGLIAGIESNSGHLSQSLIRAGQEKGPSWALTKSVWDILKNQNIQARDLKAFFPGSLAKAPDSILDTLTLDSKYERFITLQDNRIFENTGPKLSDLSKNYLNRQFSRLVSGAADFKIIPNLPRHAVALLNEKRPENLDQCADILGINSESFRILISYLKSLKGQFKSPENSQERP
jgi:tRNA uridine 5-carboxymethylaminomethyl modification enzyme